MHQRGANMVPRHPHNSTTSKHPVGPLSLCTASPQRHCRTALTDGTAPPMHPAIRSRWKAAGITATPWPQNLAMTGLLPLLLLQAPRTLATNSQCSRRRQVSAAKSPPPQGRGTMNRGVHTMGDVRRKALAGGWQHWHAGSTYEIHRPV